MENSIGIIDSEESSKGAKEYVPSMTCEVSFKMDLKDWDVTKFMKLMDLISPKMGPSAKMYRFNMWS